MLPGECELWWYRLLGSHLTSCCQRI